MKQSITKFSFCFFVVVFSFSSGTLAESVVAPASSTFVPDPNADVGVTAHSADVTTGSGVVVTPGQVDANSSALQSAIQGVYTTMNTPVPATVDPAVLAAQQQAAQAALLAQQQADAAAKAAQNQQMASVLGSLVQACSMMGKSDTQKQGSDLLTTSMAARDAMGFQYPSGIEQSYAARIGASGATHFNKGCENFMNKDGKTKSWGDLTMTLIRQNSDAFADREPPPQDILRYCPNYKSFTKQQKEMYWAWTFTSIASSESSCNPNNNNNSAPNGTAFGLFQLEPAVCNGNRNLNDPGQNISCAVNLLAKEVRNRGELMSGTSTSRNRALNTYWGPLRCDDQSSSRGGDIVGALKTRCLMTQFDGCGMPQRKCDFPSNQAALAGLADLRRSCPKQ
jgi:hypothetical protein